MSEYIDEERCRENKGYFLKLTKEEIALLTNKIKQSSEENIKIQPKLKYNIYYVDMIQKLKKTYFDHLQLLIVILEKIKEAPLLNNTTLNILSNETKIIIDKMYTYCHYYYVYAIVTLLNVDIKKEDTKQLILIEQIKNALSVNKQ